MTRPAEFEIRHPTMGDRPAWAAVRRWTPGLAQALQASGVTVVSIEKEWDDQGQGLGFLATCGANVRELVVSAQHVRDLAVLAELPRLEKLSVCCPVDTADFARLPSLRECWISPPAALGNVTASPTLRRLGLSRLELRDLAPLKDLVALRELHLSKLRIRDLAPLKDLVALRELDLSELRRLAALTGIESLPLERVNLIYIPRLASIAPLEGLPLRRVEIAGCGRIADIAGLGRVTSLEKVEIHSGPELPSLDFLQMLVGLDDLSVVNTGIRGCGARWAHSPCWIDYATSHFGPGETASRTWQT